ncbi:HPr kinase/phosphorylase [Reyranella sp.]|uniref:HPr kinase/phosphorylase n=1 Tax=Reyranella sp. TaxID=1929291 RepID=UPI003BA8A0F8
MAIRVTTYVHATCVALQIGGRWRGILLRGPSGAGKSDLALRLVEGGARLVSDDQTALARQGRGLVATPPGTLAGLLEVRGIGIVKLGRAQLLARATVALLVDLVPPDRIERLPDPVRETLFDVELPVLALTPFEASAPVKLRLALGRTAAA